MPSRTQSLAARRRAWLYCGDAGRIVSNVGIHADEPAVSFAVCAAFRALVSLAIAALAGFAIA